MGTAHTGSGKTAAFALPILQLLARDPFGVFALVLTPTRCSRPPAPAVLSTKWCYGAIPRSSVVACTCQSQTCFALVCLLGVLLPHYHFPAQAALSRLDDAPCFMQVPSYLRPPVNSLRLNQEACLPQGPASQEPASRQPCMTTACVCPQGARLPAGRPVPCAGLRHGTVGVPLPPAPTIHSCACQAELRCVPMLAYPAVGWVQLCTRSRS